MRERFDLKHFAQGAMEASPSRFLPQMSVLSGGAETETPFCFEISTLELDALEDLASARVARASAMLLPASGPRPLLARIKCSRGKCAERNFMRGS